MPLIPIPGSPSTVNLGYKTYPLNGIQGYLSGRLYDLNNQFWSVAELNLYIQEALQTWNAMTNFFRNDFVFSSVRDQTWYDLTTQPNSVRPMNSTVAQVSTVILYHLLEPPTGVVSQQFTTTQITNAIVFRLNQILGTTGTTVSTYYTGAVNGRILLPDGTFDVRRICYLPAMPVTDGYGSGSYGIGPYGINSWTGIPRATTLWRDDTAAEQFFNQGYLQAPPGIPLAYMMSTQPPISFDTDCAPGFGGQYEILLTSQYSGATIPLPNDWVHVVKWGALAYLLSGESNAKDSARAAYCEKRFQMGMQILQKAAALLAMRILNTPLQIDSVIAADQYHTSWQAWAANQPTSCYQAGLNLIALSPAPWNSYELTATVVQNAPLPVNPSDFVQVSQDVLDAIIDYAQHLASFKMGGGEFMATMPLFQNFLKEATIYNAKLQESGEFTTFLTGISTMEESRNPRMDEGVLA